MFRIYSGILLLMFLAFVSGIATIVFFFQWIGISMAFLLVLGLLAMYFMPALVLPIALLAIGVHFTGDFSFVADFLSLLIGLFWMLMAYMAYSLVKEWIKEWKENRS
ncbi:hypothetical protein [Streptococcus danieliae]|uniref:Integral membrane protein n=1 Tax=Streptococcus danieliae TaxID=747656 RepID=A0A7Z0M6B3_9STRE|nr:hypothetical protein [Streptococcus danieliae]MBF0699508.1 hypothetical protein [Streptococcus danieliae]NYS96684.1 hypothetical protein [Streptococcus danieliae]